MSSLPPRSLLFSLQLVDLKAALFRKQAEFKQEKLSHDSSTQPVRKQVSEKVANPLLYCIYTSPQTSPKRSGTGVHVDVFFLGDQLVPRLHVHARTPSLIHTCTHIHVHVHKHKPTHLDCLHMAEHISGSGQEGQERPYYCQ